MFPVKDLLQLIGLFAARARAWRQAVTRCGLERVTRRQEGGLVRFSTAVGQRRVLACDRRSWPKAAPARKIGAQLAASLGHTLSRRAVTCTLHRDRLAAGGAGYFRGIVELGAVYGESGARARTLLVTIGV